MSNKKNKNKHMDLVKRKAFKLEEHFSFYSNKWKQSQMF